LVAYNEWFERKVKGSLAAAEDGETVPDEEVRTWLEQKAGDTTGNMSPDSCLLSCDFCAVA